MTFDAGYGETEALGHATETWIGQSENYDINNITFSSYENHTTGKTSVWIYPYGALLNFIETFPGTLSDKGITEQCEVLDKMNKGKVVLTDRGFDVANLCHKKGILHNRSPLKCYCQYEQVDFSKNLMLQL